MPCLHLESRPWMINSGQKKQYGRWLLANDILLQHGEWQDFSGTGDIHLSREKGRVPGCPKENCRWNYAISSSTFPLVFSLPSQKQLENNVHNNVSLKVSSFPPDIGAQKQSKNSPSGVSIYCPGVPGGKCKSEAEEAPEVFSQLTMYTYIE